jgi:hypothetical protein
VDGKIPLKYSASELFENNPKDCTLVNRKQLRKITKEPNPPKVL